MAAHSEVAAAVPAAGVGAAPGQQSTGHTKHGRSDASFQ